MASAGINMAGQPTKYDDAFAKQAEKLCKLGATDVEIADFFEVDVRTVYNWKHANPEFFHALKQGKEEADDRVQRSLYQKAVGYEQDEVKIFMPAGSEEPVYAPFRAKIAPDTTAAIFWLKNRRPQDWRDKAITEHEGKIQTEEVGAGAAKLASFVENLAERSREASEPSAE